MKRTILTGLCAVFTLGLFAQKEKAMIIHKTDGTTIEYPIEAIRDFSFSGKSVVADDDYTQITDLAIALVDNEVNIDVAAAFSCDDPYVGNVHRQDWGILYSTSPNVTIENGTLIELKLPLAQADELYSHQVSFRIGESVKADEYNENDEGCYAELDYNTTYYFRSYVRRQANNDIYEEEYFYSAEKSIHTGNPSMGLFGIENVPAYAVEDGYVFPTEEAWGAFDEQYPYFTLSRQQNKEVLVNHWNEYLTSERIDQLKKECDVVHHCLEGTLYLIDHISEDFCSYVLKHYEGEYVLSGYSEDLDENSNTTVSYVECDASWNVPNNEYWKYTADTRKNPSVKIPLPQWMLANYAYKVEVILAPNTEPEETLPSKITVRLGFEAGGNEVLSKDYETSISECSVIQADSLNADVFTGAYLEIYSTMNTSTSNRNPDKSKFLPILRIAQIKVTPYRVEVTE